MRIQLGQGSAAQVTKNMLASEGIGSFYKVSSPSMLRFWLNLSLLIPIAFKSQWFGWVVDTLSWSSFGKVCTCLQTVACKMEVIHSVYACKIEALNLARLLYLFTNSCVQNGSNSFWARMQNGSNSFI